MSSLIRLLLYEQSDLGLHCSPGPICPKTYDHYGTFYYKLMPTKDTGRIANCDDPNQTAPV